MRVVLSRLTLGATSGSSHQAGSSLRIKYLRRARRRDQAGDTIESTADRLGLQDTIRVQSITVQNIPAMAQ
jgi:hypothetical protein